MSKSHVNYTMSNVSRHCTAAAVEQGQVFNLGNEHMPLMRVQTANLQEPVADTRVYFVRLVDGTTGSCKLSEPALLADHVNLDVHW